MAYAKCQLEQTPVQHSRECLPQNCIKYTQSFKKAMQKEIMNKVADRIVGYLMGQQTSRHGSRGKVPKCQIDLSKRHSMTRIDGDMYDSMELDQIYKVMYEVCINKKNVSQIPDSLLPPRFLEESPKNRDKRGWLQKCYEMYRVVKATDDESFFKHYGRFSCRRLNEKELLAARGTEPMAEYELHTFRLNQWNEVPRKKFYEMVISEGHTVTHSGTGITEQTVAQRYWIPNFKMYVTNFMQNCTVCQLKLPKTKQQRRTASNMMYEENPLDRV